MSGLLPALAAMGSAGFYAMSTRCPRHGLYLNFCNECAAETRRWRAEEEARKREEARRRKEAEARKRKEMEKEKARKKFLLQVWLTAVGTAVGCCFLAYIFGGTSKLCPPGTSTNSDDGARCIQCPVNTFSNRSGAQTCVDCPLGSVSLVNRTGCRRCGKGRVSTGSGNCRACPSGEVALGNSCTRCMAGTFAHSSNNSCKACPPGSWAPEASALCTCLHGWTRTTQDGQRLPAEENCFPCPANTFKAVNGSGQCTACPSEWTSAEGSTKITDCVPSVTQAIFALFSGSSGQSSQQDLWRRRMYDEISSSVEDSFAYWTSAPQELLNALVDDVFGSSEAMDSAAMDETDGEKTEQSDDEPPEPVLCPFANATEVETWMQTTQAWKDYISAVDQLQHSRLRSEHTCLKVKKATRKVLLIVHPDKFDRAHPQCAPGLSVPVVQVLNALNDHVKKKCA